MKKLLSLFMIVVISVSLVSLPIQAKSSPNDNGYSRNIINSDQQLKNANTIPEKFEGIDLFRTNFNIELMTQKEKEFYDFLINREVDRYLLENNTLESRESIEYSIKSILSSVTDSDFSLSSNRVLVTYSSAPWWHLNTVGKIGGALNIVISVALSVVGGGLASGGIRALIAKVGEAQARKIVKNVVVNKVKNTLIAWGMSKIANAIANSLLEIIMWATDPGTAIAEWIDAHDAKPNNGYIDLW